MNVRIAVTGAQGVGKTTLVRKLAAALETKGISVTTARPIGDMLKRARVRIGINAQRTDVLAVACAHLERDQKVWMGQATLYDRCMIDMLAYTKVLHVTDEDLTHLLERLTYASVQRYNLVLLVAMSTRLRLSAVPHEPDGFRNAVCQNIYGIMKSMRIPYHEVDIDAGNHVEVACSLALRAMAEA